MREGECIHWTGLLGRDLRNRRCGAGVPLFDKFHGERPGMMWRLPCIQFRVVSVVDPLQRVRPGEPTRHEPVDRRGEAEAHCARLRLPTAAELAADAAGAAVAVSGVRAAMRVAAGWRTALRPAQDRHAVVECPVCEGRLHLSQSATNGHVHGRCETAGCVSWME